ncbi:unnamed protein product [Paramecium octaurelia]|uniref:WD-40 repeat protein n=1 Tax=Paramecium octaurelia TaxID=43137 RepID=A0A8S1YLZ1_PAROT|nr:unnamed protein product [Paramecium octaurelia]
MKEIKQVYNRKEDLYQVLNQTKYFDGSYLNELLSMLRNKKITNCLECFKNYTQFQFITSMIKNVSEIEFNKKNYSTENHDQMRKGLKKQISYDQQMIEFVKFLVRLTAIDERFIQSGSNALNLLVEMKVDLREQSFENIRNRDTSLVGENFVRCNFNGSEFDNVDISGMNLNQAQLFNCQWKNIKIHELNKLDGHSSTIYSICYSPDGTILASGSADKSIRLWDVKIGQQIAKLDGHQHEVHSISYSPDGITLASGSFDKSIRLWDVMTAQEKTKLDGHQYEVHSICYSPDGTTLATGSSDYSIRLWDVKTGQQRAKLDGHSDYVRTICYSPDGTTLASDNDDKSIRLWDVKTEQQKAKLDGHSSAVYSVNFSPDGNTLASGSYDSSIRLWNIKTSKEILQSDSSYKGLLAQFNKPLHSNSFLQNVNPDLTILKICQNPLFEASGTLILQGKFINHQGNDLKPQFKSKGICFLEDFKQK